MSKRVDQLTALSDSQVAEDGRLSPLGDPATGQLYKVTMAQLKKAMSTQKYLYTATGAEGTTITPSSIAGKNIIVIFREGSPLYEVDSSPDEVEFTWDGTDVTLGLAVNYAGERFLFLYNNIAI